MSDRTDSQRIAAIEATVIAMNKSLFGNGQPGVIQEMKLKIDENGKRISVLENFRWWIAGIATAGVGSGFGLAKILETLAKHP